MGFAAVLFVSFARTKLQSSLAFGCIARQTCADEIVGATLHVE
jgi:hypothetical protein